MIKCPYCQRPTNQCERIQQSPTSIDGIFACLQATAHHRDHLQAVIQEFREAEYAAQQGYPNAETRRHVATQRLWEA